MSKKTTKWYVESEHSEEFTELLFIAEKSSSLYIAIGLHDAEGLEEFGRKYWWEVIAGEQGWKEKDAADTFDECATAALDCAASFAASRKSATLPACGVQGQAGTVDVGWRIAAIVGGE